MTNPTPPASPTSADITVAGDDYSARVCAPLPVMAKASMNEPVRVTDELPSPVARGGWPQRFQDELEAAQAANEWFEPIALATRRPSSRVTQHTFKDDGGAQVLWLNERVHAYFVIFRDSRNYSVVDCREVGALRPPSPPAVVGKPTQQQIDDKIGEWFRSDAKVREKSIGAFLLAAPIWPIEESPAKPTYIVHELTSLERESFEQAKSTLNAKGNLTKELSYQIVDIVDRFTAHPARALAEPAASVDDESRGYARGIAESYVLARLFASVPHGSLPVNPQECATQAANEIAASIRALLPAPSEGVK